MLEGGGGANGALLRAGLVDELSLVITAAIDGSSGAPTVFNSGDKDLGPAPIESMTLDQPRGARGRRGLAALQADLIRRLLLEEGQHAVAALALEVAEGAGAGGDQVAVLVVDLGLGGEGALAGRGRQAPRIVSTSPSRAALMNCVVKASVTLSRRAVAVSLKVQAKPLAPSSSVISTPPCSSPLALHSSGPNFQSHLDEARAPGHDLVADQSVETGGNAWDATGRASAGRWIAIVSCLRALAARHRRHRRAMPVAVGHRRPRPADRRAPAEGWAAMPVRMSRATLTRRGPQSASSRSRLIW